MTTFIYFLKDPENPMKGYVGKSNNPSKRFREHTYRTKESNYRANWISSLAAKGLQPVLEIVDEVPAEYWPMLEVAYIEFFREQGFILTNSNAGGEGCHSPTEETRAKLRGRKPYNLGKKLSLATRAKIKDARAKQIISPEAIEKTAAALRGRKLSPERCAEMSAARLGKKLSPEHCAAIGAAHRGLTMSPESNEKRRVAMLGKKHTPEARAKMSVSQKGRVITVVHRKAISSALKGTPWTEARWEAQQKLQKNKKEKY